MIRTLAFTVALLAGAAPAAAQTGAQSSPQGAARSAVQNAATTSGMPILKRAATVSSDIVRIGDLIDNAGDAADAPIFRSPDVGTTGAVSVQQVIDAIRLHHIYLIDTGSLSQVEVTHVGRAIDVSDIETRIAGLFAGRYGLGDAKNLTVTLDRPARPITVEASATTDLVVANAAVEPRSGRFDVTFDIPGSIALRRTPLRFTGTVVETAPAAVLTRALARGDIIKASDVAIERRPKPEVTAEVIGAVNDAIGLAVRQAARIGQPLRRTDLMKPEMVHRDDNIMLVYEVPGIMLTTRGKAIEAGAEGDIINVLNIQSKRTVQGIVTGPGRVTITTAMSRASTDAATASVPQSVASR
jgi:flagella basal body P-ring formation protein FlgA